MLLQNLRVVSCYNRKDTELTGMQNLGHMMEFYVPFGFIDRKEFMVPISRIIRSYAYNEDFGIFSDRSSSILNNLIGMIKKWLNHPLLLESYFAENIIEAIVSFLKSSKSKIKRKFC